MGVPAFFRWLTKKYPSVVANANEDRQRNAEGIRIPIDCTQPNPNFQEFDNLYLDMNGIIHPCTHPEDRPPPKNEDEMFALIFEYIDRIFSIVRPRKVLYMAIDGVAPRAKMNQQRSRRFRASKEAWEKQASIDEQRRRLAAEGIPLPPKKEAESHFDSNCITPGTPFMARLADALRYYIHDRITTDPAWAKIQVIISDANAPGEGEHKIMDFVRKQRANPAHNPDTVHCLCGADADLIMLGLATHEANFNIIREEFVPNQQRPCELCGQYGHELKDCRGLENEEKGEDYADPLTKEKNFIFLRLPVLREYLEKEMAMPNLPFPFDLERVIDDWVFLCFFVGNDFLPHLPSLEIRENAIDRLIKLYKEAVFEMNGYLTKDGEVYMEQVQKIMIGLGKVEDEIFKRRQVDEQRFQERCKRQKMFSRGGGRGRTQRPAYTPQEGSLIAPLSQATPMSGEDTRALAAQDRVQAMAYSENEEAARRLKAMLKMGGTPDAATSSEDSRKRKAETGDSASVSGNLSEETETCIHPKLQKNKLKTKKGQKRKAKKAHGVNRPPPKPKQPPPQPKAPLIMPDEEEESGPVDTVRLFETGWKDRYYRAKFDVGADDTKFRETVAWAYVEGLCWVLKYYYQGCVSWDWYFPYHYAPFASDFDTIINYKPDFSRPTKPFNPLEQLMSVFPAASKQHLPVEWQKLMVDDDSPIIDLYPTDFRIDLNGKKYAWQGVALLPFVDEVRLLKTLERVYPTLTEEEKARNTIGPNRLFIGRHHPAFTFFLQLYGDGAQVKTVDIDPAFTYGVTGTISADSTVVLPDAVFKSPVDDGTCPDIPVNGAIGVLYDDPAYPAGFIFPATRLDNATPIAPTLKPGDWSDRSHGGYRPQIGFSRDTGRAYMDQSGHRTLNHEIRDSDGYRNQRGGGGYQGRGGYNNYDNNRGGYGGGGRGGNRGGYNDGGYRNDYNGGQNNRYDNRNNGEYRGGGYGGQRGGGNRGRGRGGFEGNQQNYGNSWR